MPEQPNAIATPNPVSDALNAGAGKQASGASGSHTPEAVKLPEYMQGSITQEEFAALPQEAQKKLLAMGESLYKNVSRKETALAQDRKRVEGLLAVQDQLDADPKMAAHLEQALEDYRQGKHRQGDAQQLKDDWDQLKTEADEPGKRVLLAIEKRFGAGKIEEKLDTLAKQFEGLVSSGIGSRRQQLEEQVRQLPKEFKVLAEEHLESLLRMGTQPALQAKSARDLLRHVVPYEVYDETVFAERAQRSRGEKAQAEATALFPTTPVTTEVPEVTNEDVTESRDKRFGKRVNLGSLIRREFGNIARLIPRG